MKESNGISRRDFIRKSSAIGLGTMMLGMSKDIFANESIKAIPLGWEAFWHPESPVRLSELTHQLAKRALDGEHGRSMVNLNWNIDEVENPSLTPNMKFALGTMSVAKNVPLRILPGEIIVGSATLVDGALHRTPFGFYSISHTTLGFHDILPVGYKGLQEKIKDRLNQGGLDERGRDMLNSMLIVIDAAQVWNSRHIQLLEERMNTATGMEKKFIEETVATLQRVPWNPPADFREAVQSLWSMYAFLRLMGNWSGIGRIDEILGGYLKNDLRNNKITLNEAREVLAHFWIKGCEWIGAPSHFNGSGDAQFYQNIILGGIDENGREVTNEVTYLVLDIIEELHISDFPVAVRLNKNSPEKLLKRIAEVQRFGGGIISIYSESVVIDGLVKFGYPLKEARTFTNDGCWETLIPGKTAFGYKPFDSLFLLHKTIGLTNDERPDYPDFESLYAGYIKELEQEIERKNQEIDKEFQDEFDHPLVSMFVEGCIEKGLGYHSKGAKYNVRSIHAGGLADVANSLLVLKELIYEQEYMGFREFTQILREDWDKNEPLRKLIQNRFEFYGNDNNRSDKMLERIYNDFTAITANVKERNGILRPAGISTFGREIEWAPQRMASPSGNKKHAILATNFSPSPGTDKKGPTAAIKSFCKMDFSLVPNGATLELKILPNSVKGENGIVALTGLSKAFVELGGYYLHIDVIDSATLIDAQRHPERYANLPVRISGWSARFTTLNKEWQDMIINRTEQIV